MFSLAIFAQTDSLYRISLILPLQATFTSEKLDAYTNAHDVFSSRKIHLDEDALTALDFYQGLLQAIKESNNTFKIEVTVFDCGSSDSLTTEVLKNPELKKSDIIIGAVSSSNSRLVADYCKQNKIINVQPFTPSKSLTAENIYHLKLAPTIDAHIDALFRSIVDSFIESNIIIYTPNDERSLSAAKRFDSLFNQHNKTQPQKFTVAFLNTKDMLLNGKKTTAAEQLVKGKPNVLIITSFEESFINGNLRVLHEFLATDSIIVYGMPNWMNGELLRLDYVNDFHTRLSDAFYFDSTQAAALAFVRNYETDFSSTPSRYSFLGYDVLNFLMKNLKESGKEFLENVMPHTFIGTAYRFSISMTKKNPLTINYYENREVNVLNVQNYQLKRIR
jgi:ABC-type branched-subunit amino acid transport system substrate-binding protein